MKLLPQRPQPTLHILSPCLPSTPKPASATSILKVVNFNRALTFYCGVLGLELQLRIGNSAAFISAGSYHHHIGLNTGKASTASHPHPAPTASTTWPFYTPPAHRSRTPSKSLIAAKIPLEGDSDHGVSEALYLRDLDQNGLGLYYDRPREQWPVDHEGNFTMYTHPPQPPVPSGRKGIGIGARGLPLA